MRPTFLDKVLDKKSEISVDRASSDNETQKETRRNIARPAIKNEPPI